MVSIFNERTRDGEIARALNLALHAFSVHSRAEVTMEGERIVLDFTRETAALMHALRLLGVQPGEILPAPNFDEFDLGKKNVPGF
ncbi:hypothetical protein [Caballeronia sp. TF1N1]|uniref:hypothetical protein n=1 Tax=Caballeronia sp. TF1N1 TaxID=2878153 RepID=UPI001FD486F4|nr:hypothetical protein [Caballeronia sp. TF1N1]